MYRLGAPGQGAGEQSAASTVRATGGYPATGADLERALAAANLGHSLFVIHGE